MKTLTAMLLTLSATLFVMAPAQAEEMKKDTMGDKTTMHDDMKGDGMHKEGMGTDTMHDGMKKDGMADGMHDGMKDGMKTDTMSKDTMKKDTMSDGMKSESN
jgi:pentapeptide MXKDX repeat protein